MWLERTMRSESSDGREGEGGLRLSVLKLGDAVRTRREKRAQLKCRCQKDIEHSLSMLDPIYSHLRSENDHRRLRKERDVTRRDVTKKKNRDQHRSTRLLD